MVKSASILLSLAAVACAQSDPWPQAEQNARQAAQAIRLANRNSFAWLAHADGTTGLLPRNLKDSPFWNAKDAAADNYPFITLAAHVTDNYYLKQAVQHILAQEQKLTNRVDSLPDDLLFPTQKFRTEKPDIDQLIFGAAEYCKDGLMPITEWLGPTPWLDRMQGLVADIWKHASVASPSGTLPTRVLEVNGDLLQIMGRLYWMTGNEKYREWSFRLADHYLLETSLLESDRLSLRDHNCEIIGGLSEAYVLAVKTDPQRAGRYRPRLHVLLDDILAHGVNEDGLMYDAYNPRTGQPIGKGFSDGWGYVYNGFLTVAMVDDRPQYREAVRRAMNHLHKLPSERLTRSADELADTVEGAINLYNRLPEPSAAQWIDASLQTLFAFQRPDGTIEGWHGDGNTTRTALLYALWKTQGLTASPWVEELQIGAVREDDGTLRVWLRSGWNWSGHLRFDRPRHRDDLRMPLDYPRINQFPEWFTAERQSRYTVQVEDGEAKTVPGEALLHYPLELKADKPVRLTVRLTPDSK